MINMGEKIAWGSETALMEEAATVIDELTKRMERMREALEFYAETNHITDDVLQTNEKEWQQYCEESEPPFYVEFGYVASKALTSE